MGEAYQLSRRGKTTPAVAMSLLRRLTKLMNLSLLCATALGTFETCADAVCRSAYGVTAVLRGISLEGRV